MDIGFNARVETGRAVLAYIQLWLRTRPTTTSRCGMRDEPDHPAAGIADFDGLSFGKSLKAATEEEYQSGWNSDELRTISRGSLECRSLPRLKSASKPAYSKAFRYFFWTPLPKITSCFPVTRGQPFFQSYSSNPAGIGFTLITVAPRTQEPAL